MNSAQDIPCRNGNIVLHKVHVDSIFTVHVLIICLNIPSTKILVGGKTYEAYSVKFCCFNRDHCSKSPSLK